ncbi:MAG TPA: hypothetical protein VFP50_04895 [Anaeromyxobacteraceae bacterium]|nr:hypothetical protein [Anaeromyxobacteraceae bacterium]
MAILLAAGCAPALRPAGSLAPGTDDAPALAARVHALVRQIEHEPSDERRAALSVEAVEAGQRCAAAAPADPACDYALGVALGVQARERPSTVRKGLAEMVKRLEAAAAADPKLDQAGPDRVLALVLVRAPGWPVGPGDPDAGLARARRAVALFPDHAPNQLALAEALLATGGAAEGQAAARRGLDLAVKAAAAGEQDADGWVRDAGRLLRGAP